MVTVLSYKVFDINKDDYVLSPYKRTADGIKACRGKPLLGTEEEVDPSVFDREGRYASRLC